MNECKNCGSEIIFSPNDKGNVCVSCGSVFPIKYNFVFNKKPFNENTFLENDNLVNSLKNIQCKSCGASVLLNKKQLQVKCPYCGNTSISEDGKTKLMYIDSIVPFSFGKADALKKFKSTVNSRFFANKKIFKYATEKDINGTYVNAFIFDFSTITTYSGIFSYTKTTKDKDGKTKTETVHKHVNGVLDKLFKNITIEANSNLDQHDLQTIEPFQYASAVEFKPDFLNGYMLEYQDKIFNECVETAESIMNQQIKTALLRRHGCDRIVSLNMNIDYNDKKYNYCLLPVYFITKTDQNKGKKYKVLMNGQTGKVGTLPSDKLKVFLTIFISCLAFVAIIIGVVFLVLMH